MELLADAVIIVLVACIGGLMGAALGYVPVAEIPALLQELGALVRAADAPPAT